MIEAYLEDLERRIDPEVEEALFEKWRAFCDGEFEGAIFSPRRQRIAPAGLEWPHVLVNEALADYERMALQQLGPCSQALAEGSGAIMAVRTNYGTGIMPTLFGAELFIMDDCHNTLPTTTPLATDDDMLRRLLDRGIPDLRRGLGEKVFAMGEFYRELFAPYPRIRRYVNVYHPDLQGPMDVYELLRGSAMFLDLMDSPELAHQALALITDTYAAFMREWLALYPYAGPTSCHWSMMQPGCIMLRDDSAMNLSPDLFDDFIFPYNQRLLREFGGGAEHFCGRGEHFIPSLCRQEGLGAINLSQPEYNDMELIFQHSIDRGILIIGLRRDAAEAALLALLTDEPLHIDELCQQADLPITQVSSALALMELKGMVRRLEGMHYTLARSGGNSYRLD